MTDVYILTLIVAEHSMTVVRIPCALNNYPTPIQPQEFPRYHLLPSFGAMNKESTSRIYYNKRLFQILANTLDIGQKIIAKISNYAKLKLSKKVIPMI